MTNITNLKINEQARLADLEQKLALLMINMEENFVLIDTELKIVQFNDKFKRQYKLLFDRNVVKGESILSYAQPGRIEIVKKIYREVFSGKTLESEIQIPLPDKTNVTFLNIFKPAYDEDENIIGAFVSSKDITWQVKAQQLLVASEKRFRALVENSAEIIALMDEEGKVTYISPAITKITGYSPEEITGTSYFDIMDPNHIAEAKKVLEEIMYSHGVPVHHTNRLKHKNGHYIWVEGTITNLLGDENVLAIVANFRDITKRMEAEEKNRQSEANLRAIFDNSAEGLMLLDSDGTILAFNAKSAENHMLYNVKNDLQVGHKLIDYVDGARKEYFRSLMAKVLQGETIEYDIDYDRKDGAKNWFHASLTPVFENGIVTGICIARSDISERKKSELQLQDLLNISSDQNKRLQNFAYIVSHNIRSHSSNIIGLVEFIKKAESDTDRAKFFDMLKTSTDKLGETIENLNEIITIQNEVNIHKTKLNLKEEVRKTADVINSMITRTNATLVNDIPDNIMVEVVPSYLESILLNVLTNAIKYRHPDRDPIIKVNSKITDHYLVLSIEDNGLGIDLKKNAGKIFGMYKTFHNNKDARGFGLFISKNQIEAMDGTIEVVSEPGVGSTFKIYINHAKN